MTKYPALPSTVGKTAHTTDPEGSRMDWDVFDEIRRHEGSEKILLLQRLRLKSNPRLVMLRFGYYIIGKKPKARVRWVWGRFAPFIRAKDFAAIIVEAKAKGWI